MADGVKVFVNDLAIKPLACAFFNGKEAGALDLTMGTRKVPFITHKFVIVERGSGPIQTESRMLNRLSQSVGDGKSVNDVTYAWLHEDMG